MSERVTNADLREDILGVKTDVVALREDFVNFKQDDFASLRAHVNDEREKMMAIINRKQDKDNLLNSLVYKLMQNKGFRWAAGVIGFTLLGTVVSNQWVPWLSQLAQALGKF